MLFVKKEMPLSMINKYQIPINTFDIYLSSCINTPENKAHHLTKVWI